MQAVSPSATLHQEQQLMSALLALIKQEQQYLIHADVDSLSLLTPEKTNLVNRKTALSTQRHQNLGEAGFAPEESGMQAWLAHTHDVNASTSWLALLETTRLAKEANRVNGVLLNSQLSYNRGALAALRPPRHGTNNFYSPTGGHAASGATSSRVVVVG